MTTTAVNPPDLFNSRQYGFSQAVVATGQRTLYCSGQVGWDKNKDIGAAGDLGDQTRRSLANVERLVNAAGGTLKDIVSPRIYIVGENIWDGRAIREALRATFGPDAPPAATWIGVAALANPEFVVEIEAVAVLD